MALAKILFVDDEEYVLKAICRFFHGIYDVQTVSSADAGLQILTDDSSFAAVVADVRMPGMSGIDFLRHAHEFAPQTTRVLLTGQLSTEEALRSVNEGHVFQILLKPCPVAAMHTALEAAVQYHRSTHAHATLLSETLSHGTVAMLCDILTLVSPLAATRAARIRELAAAVADRMGVVNRGEIETAAMLSQLGCVGISGRVLASLAHGAGKLHEADSECFNSHPEIGARLLSRIPQFKEIARGVEHQLRNFDGSGGAASPLSGEALPLASRILRAVTDFDMYTAQHMSPRDAIAAMRQQASCYDPKVMRAIKELNQIEEVPELLELNVEDIHIGMTLERAVGTTDGRTLLAKGSQVTESMLGRLRAFARNGNIVQPILVSILVPRVAPMPTSTAVHTPEMAVTP